MKAGICLVYILVNPLRHSFNTSIILPSSLIIFSISSCNVLTSALTDLWLFYSSEKLYIWMMWAVFEVATFFFFQYFFFLILYSFALMSLTSIFEKKILGRLILWVFCFHDWTFTYHILCSDPLPHATFTCNQCFQSCILKNILSSNYCYIN